MGSLPVPQQVGQLPVSGSQASQPVPLHSGWAPLPLQMRQSYMGISLSGGAVGGDAVEAEAAGGVAKLVEGAYVPVAGLGAADFLGLDDAVAGLSVRLVVGDVVADRGGEGVAEEGCGAEGGVGERAGDDAVRQSLAGQHSQGL